MYFTKRSDGSRQNGILHQNICKRFSRQKTIETCMQRSYNVMIVQAVLNNSGGNVLISSLTLMLFTTNTLDTQNKFKKLMLIKLSTLYSLETMWHQRPYRKISLNLTAVAVEHTRMGGGRISETCGR